MISSINWKNIVLKNIILKLLLFLAISFVILSVIGGIRSYSPIPFWDMWESYLMFFLGILEGDYSGWWRPFNEHRIVVSRILFWLDLEIFKGLSIFLIFINYSLCALISYCFYNILKRTFPQDKDRFLRYCFSLFILAMSFSWTQKENLTWANQNQFFLAYLIPLAAFYCLYLSTVSHKSWKYFFLSCLAGIASAGTMANGVIAPAILFVLSLFFRLRLIKVIVLGVLSILLPSIYLIHFTLPKFIEYEVGLFHQPADFFKYIVSFLGNPFYYLTGSEDAAILGGIFFILVLSYFLATAFKRRNQPNFFLQLTLFAFIFYIFTTICAAAETRVNIVSSIQSRYTTPSIMIWMGLFIVFALNARRAILVKTTSFLIYTLILFLPWQIKASRSAANEIFEKKIAALATSMQIKDHKQIRLIYPDLTPHFFNTIEKAIQNNLTIFGLNQYREAKQLIGQVEPLKAKNSCLGFLDVISTIDTDSRFVRVNGWMFEQSKQKTPSIIHILDSTNRIVGYAFTGQPRHDLEKKFGSKGLHSGFAGYLLSEFADKELIFQGMKPACKFIVKGQQYENANKL